MSASLPTSLPSSFALRSRFLFSGDAPPLADAWVVVRDGHIEEVTQSKNRPAAAQDLPSFELANTALMPGLTNAHTHLEFSDLRQPLGQRGMPLPEWIRLVMAERQASLANVDSPSHVMQSLTLGWQESLSSGVTSLGEIATTRWSEGPFADSPLEVIAFRELIATDPQQAVAQLQSAETSLPWAKSARPTPAQESSAPKLNRGQLLPGLSPHAPYSTSLELVRQSVTQANQHHWPVAMHLAESSEEMEFLASGQGPFRKLLNDLGVWHADAMHSPVRPLDYLEILREAPHAFIIHGNFLDEEELRFLAAHRQQMTLVYCPRTHAYFGHPPHPVAQALSLGVRVMIGTDSRASNPNLNLFEELQFLAAATDLPRDEILRCGTRPLTEMRSQRANASFAPGAPANFAWVQLADSAEEDPYDLLLHEHSCVAATLIRGTFYPNAIH